MRRVKRSQPYSLLSLFVAATVVLLLTLVPTAGPASAVPIFCMLCGSYGTSDFLLNVLIFVPLGFFVARMSASSMRAMLAVVSITIAIELLQIFIPGRYPTFGDIAANTLGGAFGIWVLRTRHCGPGTSPHRSVRAAAVAAPFMLTGALALTIILLEPSLPRTAYYGQWTAELGQFAHYTGQVRSVRIGTVDLPGYRLDPIATRAAQRMATGAPLTVEFRAGPPTRELAPIFSIFDDRQVEILIIGVDSDAIVIRMRRLAEAVGFHAPEVRFANLHPLEGRQAILRFRRHDRLFCVRLGGSETCRIAATPARGWSLFTGTPFPAWAPGLLDAAWLALLAFATGSFALRSFGSFPGWLRRATWFMPIVTYGALWLLLPGNPAWISGLAGLIAGSTIALRYP